MNQEKDGHGNHEAGESIEALGQWLLDVDDIAHISIHTKCGANQMNQQYGGMEEYHKDG